MSSVGIAHAAADTNLQIYAYRNFANQAVDLQVCNQGLSDIKQIVFHVDSTNFVFDSGWVSPFNTPPADPGSFDFDTMTWTGRLDYVPWIPDDPNTPENEQQNNQCIALSISGHATGQLGDSVTTTISIVSSVQVDDSANVDNDGGNDSVTLDPFTITGLPDIKAEALLYTTGAITDTSEVEYQVDVSNVGSGVYHDNGFNIFAFTLPPDADFVSATDLKLGDAVGLDWCNSPGLIGTDINLPGLEDFHGRRVVLCNLNIANGEIPTGNTIYPFRIKIVAGASLAAGTADVVGIFEGNDPDTYRLFQIIARGDNLLASITNEPNDNFFYLAYDPEDLHATVDRCPGQGETTTDGTGCFHITFNKLIYEPSFTEDVIDLGGNGTVDSLTRLDDFTWELRVKDITPGSTVTMLLKLNQINDYSAVRNTTQVLGINTIRYEVGSTGNSDSGNASGSASGTASGTTSATGTLATTGMQSKDFTTAIVLLMLGLALTFVTKRKKAVI